MTVNRAGVETERRRLVPKSVMEAQYALREARKRLREARVDFDEVLVAFEAARSDLEEARLGFVAATDRFDDEMRRWTERLRGT